jgi:hypothetical protein
MAHLVTCIYCGKRFDRDKVPAQAVSARRYAHIECFKIEEAKRAKIEKDKEALEKYIMKIFNETYINARVRKQINTYIQEYEYTYSGIHKALTYFFEVKGNSVEKANGGIGIVPYVYKDAYNYYYSIWLANQKNEYVKPEDFVIPVREVHIPVPKRKVKQRKLFTFLDEEVADE